MMSHKDIVSQPVNVVTAGALVDVYRRFTHALHHFSDFDRFCESLGDAVRRDAHLSNILLVNPESSKVPPDDESEYERVFEMRKIVVPLPGAADGQYLRSSGRRDGRPFDAGDLHLLGSVAGFLSVLLANSQSYQRTQQQAHVLQALIDQLPLGVVCFDVAGQRVVENNIAVRLLGAEGTEVFERHLRRGGLGAERVQLHFEVDGQLLYAEGRSLEVSAGVSVSAFVLYDLSEARERLFLDLERVVYKAEARGGSVVVVLLESREVAGDVYRSAKDAAEDLQLRVDQVHALDAYTCACVYLEKDLRSVRHLLRQVLPPILSANTRMAMVASNGSSASEAPAQQIIDQASAVMAELHVALCAEVLVMDAYPPVVDALAMVVGDRCRLSSVEANDEVESLIRAGRFDALIFDLDGFDADVLRRIQVVSKSVGIGFKVFYSSYKQPEMARLTYGLCGGDALLQKPFDTVTIIDSLVFAVN